MALKKYVVIPYLDSETNGFTTGNVYIGGFPGNGDGDGNGAGAGFTMGGGFGGGNFGNGDGFGSDDEVAGGTPR